MGRAKQLSSLIKTLDLFLGWPGRGSCHSCCKKHLPKEVMEQLSFGAPRSSEAWGAHSRNSQVFIEWVGRRQASVWMHSGSEHGAINYSGQQVCTCVYETCVHTCGEEGPSDLHPVQGGRSQ